MGVKVPWSDLLRSRFEGQPLKRIALTYGGVTVRGEAVVTADGLEGGAVYALSAHLRNAIERDGEAVLRVDLRPDLALQTLIERLQRLARANPPLLSCAKRLACRRSMWRCCAKATLPSR